MLFEYCGIKNMYYYIFLDRCLRGEKSIFLLCIKISNTMNFYKVHYKIPTINMTCITVVIHLQGHTKNSITILCFLNSIGCVYKQLLSIIT